MTPQPIHITRQGQQWTLRMEQWLALPPEELFDFFADAHNLEQITPPTVRFNIITPPPIDMHAGTLIQYKLRVHGLPIRWTTRIDTWDPPRQFVDTQLKGPYKRWHHTHTFEPKDGGTLCRDTVQYQPPGGPLAPLINKLAVQRDVENIFRYRAQQLDKRFNKPQD
ncbi:MAG: SRPBCC family protein [Phycisphaerales bacterium JB063]